MQKIRIFSFADNKHDSITEQVTEFTKRIGRWTTLLETPLYSKRIAALPQAERIQAEGQALLTALKPADYLFLLDSHGKEYTSSGFAERLSALANQGKSSICFAIGGNFGWSETALARADERFSLSRLTFTSELAKLLLYEQLYWACCIINRSPYHH